jgi:hypothetical protein
MPSPFPGIDPYLESPDWFPDLHGNLIILMKGALQHSLPESYYAQSSQRVWLEYSRHHRSNSSVQPTRRTATPGGRSFWRNSARLLPAKFTWWRSTSSVVVCTRWPSSLQSAQRVPCLSDYPSSAAPPDRYPPLVGRSQLDA